MNVRTNIPRVKKILTLYQSFVKKLHSFVFVQVIGDTLPALFY